MKGLILILFFVFSILQIGYAQNDEFKKGNFDSLGGRVGFHIQFLDSSFLMCNSKDAVYKQYVYFVNNKPLKYFSLPPKLIRHYKLDDPTVRNARDSILLLDGRYPFYHKKKIR